MIEYPKIETLYNRDPENMKRVIEGDLRLPEFELVKHWHITEKVDGTNVRIIFQGDTEDGPGSVRIGGRTDDAQMPLFLHDTLTELFPYQKLAALFDYGTKAVLFGEGYGPKIEKGADYAPRAQFILFDVAVIVEPDARVWWLNWLDVADVADKLDIPVVPVLADSATLEEALDLVRDQSVLALLGTGAQRQQEGIVARTSPQLFDRRGHRIMWKLKGRDLAP